ncbi:MAG: AbrB/MazE/SpoVT family DNA-binding domain-containing protein [Chrysiogenetes bacterium]|nr:AbrB/MazE/SpoVT family DNA-binding domain-containing protein [Chrysiogenetes bacterium]
MKKRLTPIGNSLGLVIEKPILELLNIDRETELEILTDGNALFVRPVRTAQEDEHREKVREAAKRVMTEYYETFKKLADS